MYRMIAAAVLSLAAVAAVAAETTQEPAVSSGQAFHQDPLYGLKRLAGQGDPNAMYDLGLSYQFGVAASRDAAEAAHWYKQAADLGHAGAQNKLGELYSEGAGVQKSFGWAAYWAALAARQGNAAAATALPTYLGQLRRFRITKPATNVRASPDSESRILYRAKQGETVYRLHALQGGWAKVYFAKGHLIGYVAEYLLEEY